MTYQQKFLYLHKNFFASLYKAKLVDFGKQMISLNSRLDVEIRKENFSLGVIEYLADQKKPIFRDFQFFLEQMENLMEIVASEEDSVGDDDDEDAAAAAAASAASRLVIGPPEREPSPFRLRIYNFINHCKEIVEIERQYMQTIAELSEVIFKKNLFN